MILKSIKNLFKKKPKVKEVVKKEIKKEEPLVLIEEIKKPKIKETKETKSSLTFGE